MRSIVYNGIDLSEWCSAEVVEKVAMPVVPDTMVVPGRAGALLVSGCIPPRIVRVRLPDEPELEYRDAVCTDAGSWSSLFEDGEGEVVFTLLDPVAYGRERTETGAAFEVGGSWPT